MTLRWRDATNDLFSLLPAVGSTTSRQTAQGREHDFAEWESCRSARFLAERPVSDSLPPELIRA